MSQSGWVQEVMQNPWDPMVGIPSEPQSGYSWLSYVGIDCSYDENRYDLHPMFEGDWNCTCTIYA
jgi:hypothetical protein